MKVRSFIVCNLPLRFEFRGGLARLGRIRRIQGPKPSSNHRKNKSGTSFGLAAWGTLNSCPLRRIL
jgi:hypothetical protein